MTSEDDKQREAALAEVAPHGWRSGGETTKGYLRMLCGCGDHLMWLPKTPSNRNTFKNKAKKMISTCSIQDPRDAE